MANTLLEVKAANTVRKWQDLWFTASTIPSVCEFDYTCVWMSGSGWQSSKFYNVTLIWWYSLKIFSRKQEIQKDEKDICTIDAGDADAYGVRAYMSEPFNQGFKNPYNELKLTAPPWEGMLQKLDARCWGHRQTLMKSYRSSIPFSGQGRLKDILVWNNRA